MSQSVAVVAAHPDDEALGCGGTIAGLARRGIAVHVLLMADGETSRPAGEAPAPNVDRVEARRACAVRAGEILGCATVEVLDLPDNRLDGVELLTVVKRIESFLEKHRPGTLFTHHSGDVNVDHRVVHNAVIAATRPQPGYFVRDLLFFEVPSSTEWQPPGTAQPFNPNWFVDISGSLDTKLAGLRAYEPELRPFPHPRSLRAVEALARWRGATAGVDAAEAFVLGRRIVDGLADLCE